MGIWLFLIYTSYPINYRTQLAILLERKYFVFKLIFRKNSS